MPQSLAISSHFRKNQLVGGAASFVHNLLRGIEAVRERDARFRDLEVTVYHGPDGAPYHSDQFHYRELSNRFGRFGADARFGAVESQRYDVSLFPNYYRPPLVRSGRSVVVFHDLIPLHTPELVDWRKLAWLRFAYRYALKHADAIVTISKDVKRDVLETYGSRWESKLHPIHHPLAFERFEGGTAPAHTQGRPYILSVGVDRPHKNLHTVIRSFNKLRDRFPDHRLVVVGDFRSRRPTGKIHSAAVSSSAPPTVDVVRELGLEDQVVTTGFVSDAELGALYRGAAAFVLPSLIEGMGAPAVESMAMGAPTIVTDIPVLREVTLDSAYYLPEPKNVDAVAATIAEVLAKGEAARPSAETIARVRGTFNRIANATKYLELMFDMRSVERAA